jgi:hypothetical protein
MRKAINYRIPVILAFTLMTTAFTRAQSFRRSAELGGLNKGIVEARAKVAVNEKKVAAADSIINMGSLLTEEATKESKEVEAARRKLDKEYGARQKVLLKLSASKDRAETSKARADLKSLTLKYRSDIKDLTNRSKEATKKLTKGNAALKKGKAARQSAAYSLKVSKAALKDAQARYDAAYFSGGNPDPNK